MKIVFKAQPFQERAVNSVVSCFKGQAELSDEFELILDADHQTFCNCEVSLDDTRLLENIQSVQRENGIQPSSTLLSFTTQNSRGEAVAASNDYHAKILEATNCHIDLEMETGTGKTFCYINTFFELNRKYGWTKFIVVVPTIAIREGVYKQLKITKEYFLQKYGKSMHYFIYNSQNMNEIDSFAKTTQLTAMIINIQAFASRSRINRRIHDELDEFQSRKPIDVLSSTRPILVLDEPQRMEGEVTLEALNMFNPLFIMRYSATHKTRHNTIFRLDSLDAYQQKLVKRISVIGIESNITNLSSGYIHLEGIERYKGDMIATMVLNKRTKSGNIVKSRRRLKVDQNLYRLSGGLEQYSNNYIVIQMDYVSGTVEFANGQTMSVGEVLGDESSEMFRRIQIREAVKAHLDRERALFAQGIKVLSLFFIDKVQKYRDYSRSDLKGEYARIFEEEYRRQVAKIMTKLSASEGQYVQYIKSISAENTHNGYFSVDKKSDRFVDSDTRASRNGMEETDAYDLILKDMERLLSFKESTRFIFSHSALREGWDNPNIFTLCMLKNSDNQVSRHQEIGRGLRLCVNQFGQRVDDPSIVHEFNVLTIVANESYKDFTAGLQVELIEKTKSLPRCVKWQDFLGAILVSGNDRMSVDSSIAMELLSYLESNNYLSVHGAVTQLYFEHRSNDCFEALPLPLSRYCEAVHDLVHSVVSGSVNRYIENGKNRMNNPLNENFEKAAFRKVWSMVNKRMIYRVEFDSNELIENCAKAINERMSIQRTNFKIRSGHLRESTALHEIKKRMAFDLDNTRLEWCEDTIHNVEIDIVGDIAQKTKLTRRTIGSILSRIDNEKLKHAVTEPEHLVEEVKRVIDEQMTTVIIERLCYDSINEEYSSDIFTANQIGQDFNRATKRLNKHIYDHVITDSSVERDIAYELDSSRQIEVFAKLPRGFQIPTPFGGYNPDWAIAFKKGTVKHVYFIAETKGSITSLELRQSEFAKIESARKFFRDLNNHIDEGAIKYGVVSDFDDLMNLVK